jgi:hypothetical protein
MSGRAKQIADRISGANQDLLGCFLLRLRHTDPRKLHHLRRRIGTAPIKNRFKAQLPSSDL